MPNLGVVSDAFSDRWLLLLSVAIGVQHTEVRNKFLVFLIIGVFQPFLVSCSGQDCLFAYTNLFTHESVYSSLSLLNEYLWYDKLWGPSQRVVTLFSGFTLE